MNRTCLIVFVGTMFLAFAGCQSYHPNTTLGGLLGGTTGGLVGASIGSHDGKSGEGALIGAVAGGLTGAAIGNQADQANQRAREDAQQDAAEAQQSAVTMEQVYLMTQSGLSDELILNQIRNNGIDRRVTTNDVIQLKSYGVSEEVIRQMQNTGTRSEIGSPHSYPSQPAIHVVPGVPACQQVPVFRPPPVFWHGPAHRRHHRAHAGFSWQL